MEPLQIESLLTAENTAEHFASLARRYARASISGMVPKFIAPEKSPEEALGPLGKPTLRTSRHIVKGSDDSTPYLGFNEFYSMRVLERLNVVPVARTRMSDDGRGLVVERFDVDEQGTPTHGLEDACGLLGLPPHEKYATTTEKVLNATRTYLPPAHVRVQLEQFGWHVLVNYVVRNADCHAKNIALYYTRLGNVGFTPVYDSMRGMKEWHRCVTQRSPWCFEAWMPRWRHRHRVRNPQSADTMNRGPQLGQRRAACILLVGSDRPGPAPGRPG